MTSPTRGRGAVREWTKTCSDYDADGNATEVLYQTVFQGKVYEIRATPDEVVFFQSPRRQVRAPALSVMEAIGSGETIEDALDQHILHVAKPEAIVRFGSLTSRFEAGGAGAPSPAGAAGAGSPQGGSGGPPESSRPHDTPEVSPPRDPSARPVRTEKPTATPVGGMKPFNHVGTPAGGPSSDDERHSS